jgi:hypothetical protein
MDILRDNTLSIHHPAVTQSVMFIFHILGMQSVAFLEDCIPDGLEIMRKCGRGLREVCSLVRIYVMLSDIIYLVYSDCCVY